MFPLHPDGFFSCPAMDWVIKLNPGAAPGFPENMMRAAKEYTVTIDQLLKTAPYLYDMNRGWVHRRTIRPVQEKIGYDGYGRVI